MKEKNIPWDTCDLNINYCANQEPYVTHLVKNKIMRKNAAFDIGRRMRMLEFESWYHEGQAKQQR